MTTGVAALAHQRSADEPLGGPVRRITGRSLGTVFREEIAAPLGADFHIGLPPSQDPRVAELIPPAGPAPMGGAGDSELRVNAAGNPKVDVQVTRTRAWRGAEIPAVGGIGNARAMAEIHAILAIIDMHAHNHCLCHEQDVRYHDGRLPRARPSDGLLG